MPRLPLQLRTDQPALSTPQNSPAVVQVIEGAVPQQLRLPSIEPEFNQFQRTRKLQFTGRGLTVVFSRIAAVAVPNDYDFHTSDPLPFRALVRSMIFWNDNGGIAPFFPFTTSNRVDGSYAAAALPSVSNMFQGVKFATDPAVMVRNFYAFGQFYLPLNYLIGSVGQRVGICHQAIWDSAYYHYILECLEVADEP